MFALFESDDVTKTSSETTKSTKKKQPKKKQHTAPEDSTLTSVVPDVSAQESTILGHTIESDSPDSFFYRDLSLLLQQSSLVPSSLAHPDKLGFEDTVVRHYIQALHESSQPEAATELIIKHSLQQFGGVTLYPQSTAGEGGAIDFTLSKRNEEVRVALEVKPLFVLDKKNNVFVVRPLAEHKEQIMKYLKSFEYVALTNVHTVRLFSRTSVRGTFQPFIELSYADFLKECHANPSVWEAFRRLENETEKTDLDAIFYGDLKQWISAFDVVEFDLEGKKLSKQEAIILLLNKIIFIRTAEDFKLVDFNYLKDEYARRKRQYQHRNREKFFDVFFSDIEDFFYEHYNTDLFAEPFWQYIRKTPENILTFENVFELVVGLRDRWDDVFGTGLLHYNYRQINEDIFGKAYETFIAESRKDSGIYYTPRPLTEYIARNIVRAVCEPLAERIESALDKDALNLDEAESLLQEFYSIRFADIASGSGSFLVKVLRELFGYYSRFRSTLAWTNSFPQEDLFSLPKFVVDAIKFKHKHFPHDVTIALRLAIRHIHAADLDERALETAKTNLWKEIIKLAPEAYQFYRIKESHILPNLSLNFATGDALLDTQPHNTALLEHLATHGTHALQTLHSIRSAYLDNPFKIELLQYVEEHKQVLRTLAYAFLSEYDEHFAELIQSRKPLITAIEFFYCFFTPDATPLPVEHRGFHGLLSNPPWEVIKPIAKEFAGIGKFAMEKKDFDAHFRAMLKEDKAFAHEWKTYVEFYDTYRLYLREQYPAQGQGDLNYFKVFTERNLALLRTDAHLGILIPSGIQTDKECKLLREKILYHHTLTEIASFENRGYDIQEQEVTRSIKFFEEVDNRFKFSILFLANTPPQEKHHFSARFYMRSPEELLHTPKITYEVEQIQCFSPDNLSLMECASDYDYNICVAIRGNHRLLGEQGYVFHREFHMTDDAWLFGTKKKNVPLYEGKMIHQFTTQFAEPRYFLDNTAARNELIRAEMSRMRKALPDLSKEQIQHTVERLQNGELNMECDFPRLVYRAVASSTNERTLIAAIVPGQVFMGHSLNYVERIQYSLSSDGHVEQHILADTSMWYLCALLNSLTLNYYIRNKVSANITMHFMYELPLPHNISEAQRHTIAQKAQALQEAKDRLLVKRTKTTLGYNESIIRERAELEVMIARDLYGLSKEQWQHITSTFVYGEGMTRIELDAIIASSLEMWL